MRELTEVQARGLSSGTIASLTGRRRYAEIEPIYHAFVAFCKARGGRGAWQDAWHEFYWTVERVKAELPEVPVKLGSKGEVVKARIAGRFNRFASVLVPGSCESCGVGWQYARGYEFAWSTIANALNTGAPLRV